ncbi:MAG: hypothetical protein ACLTZY_15955 [Alistipes indistinctus]
MLRVYGDAWVSGDARLCGDAQVYGNAQMYGDARVSGDAWVSGDAQVYGNAQVSGDARVYGNAQVYGDARMYGDAQVYGDARVYGNAQVYGNAFRCPAMLSVSNNNEHCGFDCFGSVNRHTHAYKTQSGKVEITCGCFRGSIEEFDRQVKKTHQGNEFERQYMAIAEVIKIKFGLK